MHSSLPPAKRGRPPKYVTGRDGKPVVGLSFDRGTSYFYVTGSKPRRYLGRDFDEAILRLRAEDSNAKTVRLADFRPLIDPADLAESVAEGWISREAATKPVPWPVDVPESVFWAEVRMRILADPSRAAERTGIPQLARLNQLELPRDLITLKAAGKLYLERRRRVHPRWEQQQRILWAEFCTVVGKATLREISRADVERYQSHVWTEYERKRASPTYVHHRFACVRTVLRNALKRSDDQASIRRVLDLCERFELPRKSGTDPRPIAPADFRKLLAAAIDAKWVAIYLLALNCAFYPTDVAGVEWRHIDLEKRTLVMDRGKTGVPRIAVLWARTVEALKRLPRRDGVVFRSKRGGPYDPNHIGRNFRRFRTTAGVDRGVSFDAIRDGAYTSAIAGGADLNQAKMLAGHRVGISDHYLKRNPSMVAAACAAIERAYFGTELAIGDK